MWLSASIFFGLDETVHTIFALKYWVLSRRIKEIVTRTLDTNLNSKVKTIFTVQILIILSTTTTLVYLGSTGKYYSIDKIAIFNAFLCLPPFISFFILAEALYKLSKCEGGNYTLSKP